MSQKVTIHMNDGTKVEGVLHTHTPKHEQGEVDLRDLKGNPITDYAHFRFEQEGDQC
jgi:putative aminopeptidase FrvX